MARWMDGFLTENKTMQYAYANISLYRSVCLITREKEGIFFCSKTKNISKQQSQTQNQRQEALSKLISLFQKQWEGEESLFLKEKQEAHYMQMH